MHDLEDRLRLEVYRSFVERGHAPVSGELADSLRVTPHEVLSGLRSLAERHAVTFLPGSDILWMANPFSNVPTDFVVSDGSRRWWGNCIWDAFGILGALGRDGTIATHCPDCAEEMTFETTDLDSSSGCVVHFAVPAKHWWDNIGHT